MVNLRRFSNFRRGIRNLIGTYPSGNDRTSIWQLIPKTDNRLQNIPDNGYTFTAFRNQGDKPDIVPFTTDEEIEIGVVSKEMLQIFLNIIPYQTPKTDRPFVSYEGIALCYGSDESDKHVFITVYRYNRDKLHICGDGSGGDNLTPCRIPAP